MVKHTQTNRRQFAGNLPTIFFSVFDHFMNLALKGLICESPVAERSGIIIGNIFIFIFM